MDSKSKLTKILIAAGGTGGHVFPSVCVARELVKSQVMIQFVTDKRGAKYLAEFESEAVVQNITTSSRVRMYLSLLLNTVLAVKFLIKNKYDCVIGFGGYPSVPFVLAAQLLKIKTVIHEQNAVVGKANKLLSRYANKVLTSFPKTKNLIKSEKVNLVGVPTRFENVYGEHIMKKDDDLFTILIFGGSQGARIFSKNIAEVVCSLNYKNLKIFNQVPKEFQQETKDIYSKHGVQFEVESFFENIDELFLKADLVISRAGASSVFEIIGFQKPSILIPYKKSINGDQQENAAFLDKHKSAIVIDESNLNKGLKDTLTVLVKNQNKLNEMQTNISKLRKANTTQKFCVEVLKTIQTN